MKRLLTHPLFGVGLALRLLLMAVLVPKAAAEWYAPFMDASVAHFSLDPWGAFLARGGAPQAFPYGVAMWLALLPLTGQLSKGICRMRRLARPGSAGDSRCTPLLA